MTGRLLRGILSASKSGDPYTLSALRWLPDGKRVSFVYNQARATPPAD